MKIYINSPVWYKSVQLILHQVTCYSRPGQYSTPLLNKLEQKEHRKVATGPNNVYRYRYKDTLPALATMVQKNVAVRASSAPVERLFSIAGKVFKPDRGRLMDKNFESVPQCS